MNLSSPMPSPQIDAARLAVRGLTRLKFASWASVTMCAMALAVSLAGLLPTFEIGVVTAYCVSGNAVFYLLVRSGVAARFRDPACVFPHHLFILSILLLGCILVPQDRGVALQICVLVWAFDMHRLSRRQMLIAGVVSAGGLLVILITALPTDGDGQTLQSTLVALGVVAMYVPLMIAITQTARHIMMRETRQRAALDSALSQLHALAKRDSLTGASNRRHALDVLASEAKRQRRTQRPFSVAMLDLDFFKRINDRHGHAVGDSVLVETTRRLGELLPEEFTVARWGGEEFLIVMPDMLSAAAAQWMQQARAGIASGDWSGMAPGLHVDVSIGVSEHRLSDTPDMTVERADQALYQAKEGGRGRVVEQSD